MEYQTRGNSHTNYFSQHYARKNHDVEISQVYQTMTAMTAGSAAVCWLTVNHYLPSSEVFAGFVLLGALGLYQYISQTNRGSSWRPALAAIIAAVEGSLAANLVRYVSHSALTCGIGLSVMLFTALTVWAPLVKQRHLHMALAVVSSMVTFITLQRGFGFGFFRMSDFTIMSVLLAFSALSIVEATHSILIRAEKGTLDVLDCAVRLHSLLMDLFRFILVLLADMEDDRDRRNRKRRNENDRFFNFSR